MTKKRQQPRLHPIDDDPAVKAAHIAQGGAQQVAIITAVATILVAVIGGLWTWLSKSAPPVEDATLVLRVIDNITDQGVKKAKVSVEGNGGVPSTDSTDSEGVISFPVNDLKKELRIRVDADGYEPYDLRLVPADKNGVQEIRLTSVKKKPDMQPSVNPNPPSSVLKDKAHPPSNKLTAITGRVEDETGAGITNARVSVAGGKGEAYAMTNESGYFKISVDAPTGQSIELQVEKKGYNTKTQGHLTGPHPATIVLKAHQ